MSQLRLTPQQFAAMVLLETRIASLLGDAQAASQLGAKLISDSIAAAAASLQRAHEEFLTESQRTVAIAAPGDLAKLVAP